MFEKIVAKEVAHDSGLLEQSAEKSSPARGERSTPHKSNGAASQEQDGADDAEEASEQPEEEEQPEEGSEEE